MDGKQFDKPTIPSGMDELYHYLLNIYLNVPILTIRQYLQVIRHNK
jgi:hypothetical protein